MVKKILLSVLILTSLMGCQMTKSTNLTPADLYGEYELVQVDQSPIEKTLDRAMTLSFEQGVADNLKVYGVLCNNFMGQVALKQGKITSQGLASTRMSCFREKEATMENFLNAMLAEGASLTLQSTTLTIEGAGHKFVYKKR